MEQSKIQKNATGVSTPPNLFLIKNKHYDGRKSKEINLIDMSTVNYGHDQIF